MKTCFHINEPIIITLIMFLHKWENNHICGINLPNRLCPRSEWHVMMFSGFYLDIEQVAVPAKCLSLITYLNLKVVCETY